LGKAWPALGVHVPGCDPQLVELVLAELDDFQPTAIQDADELSPLLAFFTTAAARDAAARALAEAFGTHLFVESIEVEDENWAARSQAQLQPVTVGRLMISPEGSDPLTNFVRGSDPMTRIVIRASMGFGTGHHATTRLMLAALQALPVAGRTVLDIGCGSGVLAIAAAHLGARTAVGVDVDPDALQNAAENCALNGVDGLVHLDECDFRERASPAELVLANLTGGLLTQSAARLAALVVPQGCLVVSGFMEVERASVTAAFDPHLMPVSTSQEDEWLCAIYMRPGASEIPPDIP